MAICSGRIPISAGAARAPSSAFRARTVQTASRQSASTVEGERDDRVRRGYCGVTARKFMVGEPMNEATNLLSGLA